MESGKPSSCRLSILSLQLSALAVLLSAGCVDRTLIIRSDPPGASVVVNGDDAGIAPVRLRFKTYGAYEVVMAAPRHQRLRAIVPVEPPWYERFPIDFFSEAVWPFMIHDDHAVTLAMKPLQEGGEAGLDEREQQLRDRAHRGESAAAEAQPEGK